MNENRISAIYRISCSGNEKIYVGSTCDFTRRKSRHLAHLRDGKHVNQLLQRAFSKYGEETFEFEVMMLIEPERLRAKEQEIINLYFGSPYCMNLASEVGKPKPAEWTEERRDKQRKIQKGNRYSCGLKRSPEFKEVARMSNKDKVLSEETKRKISEYQKNKEKTSKGTRYKKSKIALSKEELVGLLKTHNKEQIARMFNVTSETVRNRCKEFGIELRKAKPLKTTKM